MSAAGLATVETMDELLKALCGVLSSASEHIRLAQLFVADSPDGLHPRPVCRLDRDEDCGGEVGSQAITDSLSTVAGRALREDRPVEFRLGPEATVTESESDRGTETAGRKLPVGLALPFSTPPGEQRIAAVLLADTPDYFAKVGLEPFLAYAGLCSALLNQARRRQQLSSYATFDGLTGLLNRRPLAEILEREHVRAERYNRRYSLLFFDLDHFDRINEAHGRAVGDQALQAVARIAVRVLREGDWIGRWGGEEFLCILPDAAEGEAERIAQRLRTQLVDHPLVIDGHAISLTLSVGVACFPQDGYDINTLLVHADAGLADAKRSGCNCVRRYSPPVP